MIALVLLVLAAPPQLFKSSDGNTWRVTKSAGDSRPTYEQWYLDVERVGADGSTIQVTRFEELAWVEPGLKRTTRVTFSLDAKGLFQAEQRTSMQTDKGKPELTVMIFRWDGKAFKPTPAP